MRGLPLAVLGALGLGAWWRKRRQHDGAEGRPDETWHADGGPDPAEELRARLAESRAAVDDAGENAQEPIGEEPERSPLDPESRRRDVHDRARASIDELG